MKIRSATIDDAKDIQKIYAFYVKETNVTFEYEAPDVEDMRQRIAWTLIKYPYLVAEIDHRVIGYAYASAFHERKAYQWSCELSVYVDKDFQRNGVARQLYEKIFSILKMMHIEMVYVNITHPNIKSEKFHESFGFKEMAIFKNCGYKFDTWQDVIWMSKRIGGLNAPQEIIWFSDLK